MNWTTFFTYFKNSKAVFPKQSSEREMIRGALLDNFFFRKLNKEQIDKLTDAMAKRTYPKGPR